MHASKIARAKVTPIPTSILAVRRSTVASRPLRAGHEQAGHEQESTRENTMAKGSARGVSWDFSKIPLFPPGRANHPQRPTLGAEPALPGIKQPKLAVGRVDDPLEHETDRVVEQMMRGPDLRVPTASIVPQPTHKCAACEKKAAKAPQSNLSAEGETIGPEAVEMEGVTLAGEAEVPVDFIGPLRPGDTRAVPADFIGPLEAGVIRSASFHPTISVMTAGTRTSDCGAYTYKVKWGIPAVESKAAGWIVQKVNKQFEATDCGGNRVSPKPFDDPAGYPFWEAWEFTAGQNVWVGPAAGASPHTGDTFSGDDYGDGTKGKKTITAEVKAIVGFVLPAGMTVRNAAPSWALPYTKSTPAQFASTLTGASHTLTSEWNCCPSGTVTQATNVATNP